MKKIKLSKLSLNQMTVSKLQDAQMQNIKGGDDSSAGATDPTGWRQCGSGHYYTERRNCPE